MKTSITKAQSTRNYIFHQLIIAKRLQAITNKELAEACGVTNGRITQIFDDQRMSVMQLCDMADALGLEVKLCAKSDVSE